MGKNWQFLQQIALYDGSRAQRGGKIEENYTAEPTSFPAL